MYCKRLKQIFNATTFMTAVCFLLVALPLNATNLNVATDFYGIKGVVEDPNDSTTQIKNVEVTFNDGSTTTTKTTDAGEFIVTFEDGTKGLGYCVDLGTPVFYGDNEVTFVSTIDYSANGIYVEWLIDSFSGTGTNIQSAALQLAIWETLTWTSQNQKGLASAVNLIHMKIV